MTALLLTASVVDDVADLLNREIGLRPDSSLRGRLRRCVQDAATSRQLTGEAYLDTLRRDGAVLQSLIEDITVQETSFFRHPDHFVILAREIVPQLAAPVTIWSAGCANGQEAYSLAMILDELGVAGSVVATDLSADALARTATGRYSTREVSGVSAERRGRYLAATADGWEVTPALRARVTTVRHNLVDPLPHQVLRSRVIFCRNLLIYLSAAHTRTFLGRVAQAYPPGTPVFVGAAEVLWHDIERFAPERLADTYFYRIRPPGSTPPPVVPPALHPGDRRPLSGAAGAPPVGRAPAHRSAARPAVPHVAPDEAGHAEPTAAALLARTGQAAMGAGDPGAAVVAFRACAYITPEDPMAHLHLGFALEAAGAAAAAHRTFAVALRALSTTDPAAIESSSEGYSAAELFRLLEMKLEVARR